ncbi:hypothetical protein OHC33_009239 [Knufia fluminis]|uniref:Mmc1 C-terminal domain-containing protein n=1 Tax=Knufia fluminis TaxID=191047 RepID=A0AAN8IJ09_9EURO|nr:hypothetical protein OHC33_009239 [Knufia fluminis]
MKACAPAKQFDKVLRKTFLCPSCSSQRVPYPAHSPRKRPRLERHASTLSTTAINGTRQVPQRNLPLYEALTEVKAKASGHVNLSRLQLALQGLESERPVTRIALLGLDVQDVARQIVRLLLADALEDAQPWEEQILQQQAALGILIRYGQPQNSTFRQRTTLPILHVPSPVLERLNVELLISSVNAEHGSTTNVPAETFLAPAVGVPTAFDGRQVTVNQPVHSTLLVAQGFDELVMAIQLMSATTFHTQEDKHSVVLVANLPGGSSQSQHRVLISDTVRAEKGLAAIRQSTSQASLYSHAWTSSGIPQIMTWFEEHSTSDKASQYATSPVGRLVSALLGSAALSIGKTDMLQRQSQRVSGLDIATRTRIESAVEDFSRAAHQELQSGLASAWSSRNWRKLSWYKLFWRVDDVGLIISDLVTNTWLPKTERAVYEISGRLTQIGISPVMAEPAVPETHQKTAFEPEPAKPTILDPTPALLATATTSPSNEITTAPSEPVIETAAPGQSPTVEMRPSPMLIPITTTISTSRSSYLNRQITILTTTAQQLVFRTLSISGLSAGLSALTYVSTIAPTLYEAGSIFAAGTVFALYRMQTGWQQATKTLERGLFEEGREVVRRVVQRMRELVAVKATEKAAGDPIEQKMLEDARGAVEQAQRAFEELHGQSAAATPKSKRL